MIVTYDQYGITEHPNNCAVFEGVKKMMQDKMVSETEVLTLNTVNILRKYIAFADVNLCFADEWQAFRLNICEAYSTLA